MTERLRDRHRHKQRDKKDGGRLINRQSETVQRQKQTETDRQTKRKTVTDRHRQTERQREIERRTYLERKTPFDILIHYCFRQNP